MTNQTTPGEARLADKGADRAEAQQRAAADRVHGSRRFLTTLILAVALGPLALSSFVPGLPTLAEDFGVGPGQAQLALSLSMISIAVMTLLYGPLSDYLGRRRVMLGSFVFGIGGSLVGWLAQDMIWVIAGRVVQAAGFASGMVVARAIVQDVYGAKRMASVMGNITAAMMLAPLLGPVIGGFLVEGVGWRATFALMTLSGLSVLVAAVFLLPETHFKRASHVSARLINRDFKYLLKNRNFLRFSLYVVLAQSGLLTFIGGAPLIIEDVYGRPASAYGLYVSIMAAGYMLGSLAAGRWGTKLGRGPLLWTGTVTGALGLGAAVILAAVHLPSLYPLSLAIAVGAWGVGFALPAAQAGYVAAAPHIAGSASGLSGFLQMMMLGVSTQLVGLIQGDLTAVPTIATMFVMVAAAPIFLWRIQPYRGPAPTPLRAAAAQ